MTKQNGKGILTHLQYATAGNDKAEIRLLQAKSKLAVRDSKPRQAIEFAHQCLINYNEAVDKAREAVENELAVGEHPNETVPKVAGSDDKGTGGKRAK